MTSTKVVPLGDETPGNLFFELGIKVSDMHKNLFHPNYAS
jgi:hypothetical protein